MTETIEFDEKYMVGTEGKQDYIVIAKHGDLSIGVKPVLAPQNVYTYFIGLRVRCHHNIEKPTIKVADYLAETPCLFKWDNLDNIRASSMFGAILPLPYKTSEEAITKQFKEANVGSQLIDQLSGIFQIDIPMKDINDFIKVGYEYGLKNLLLKVCHLPKPEYFDEAVAQILHNNPNNLS